MAHAIITGGSGFVGAHLINHLQKEGVFEKIINVDYKAPALLAANGKRIQYIEADIRQELDAEKFKDLGCGPDTVIYNLAAICKIPGYPRLDYFRTNIRGAETVCRLAEDLEVKNMVFTSSISIYGPSEVPKTERSIPQPTDAYGSSKLAAEYIHKGWQQKKPEQRNLAVLRPGIIFGKHEQANFTRLYQALKKGIFVYPGRRDSRKACIYVKDVARACHFFSKRKQGLEVYNLVYEKAPTIESICRALNHHTNVKPPRITIPGSVLKGAARMIHTAAKLSGKEINGIHPDRVDKVMLSTNISGEKLAQSSFKLKYPLDEGIKEWHEECEGSLY